MKTRVTTTLAGWLTIEYYDPSTAYLSTFTKGWATMSRKFPPSEKEMALLVAEKLSRYTCLVDYTLSFTDNYAEPAQFEDGVRLQND